MSTPPPPSRIGVCSWSLRPRSARDLAERAADAGFHAVQLALDPVRRADPGWSQTETLDALRACGVRILSGMMAMEGEDYSTLDSIARTGGVRPDHTWETNLAAARASACLAQRLGLSLVTFHAGFIPHQQGPERTRMLDRLRTLAEVFHARGVRVALETGQESADTLLAALHELDRAASSSPPVGVNFDPANMILYGMGDPVAAVRTLARRILQVHVKDALPADRPGEWGAEVRAGTGRVDWPAFFAALREIGFSGDLVVEREAGESRSADASAARRLAERLWTSPPTTRPPVGVGVIGLGFMGATHIRAFRAADLAGTPSRLVAVSDPNPDRLRGRPAAAGNLDTPSSASTPNLFDPDLVRACADPDDLLADPAVELVSICTPTDSHAPLAIAALRAGKHVLIEKPVALRAADVQGIADEARRAGRLCMPAMCMRFWPGWDWLRDRVLDRRYGRLLSATFQRLGSPPSWNRGFYGDPARSGGALFDLHIHDADFVRWCFGPPADVHSTGTTAHITTLYRYDADPAAPTHVVAEGGQDFAPGFGFRMRYSAAFEHAAADWDLARTPTLVVSRDGRADPIDLPEMTAYERQAEHIVLAVRDDLRNDQLRATIDQAVEVTRLLEAERAALNTYPPRRPPPPSPA